MNASLKLCRRDKFSPRPTRRRGYFCRVYVSGLLQLLFLAVIPFTAGAFSPDEEGHLGITSSGVTPVYRDINGFHYTFSARAIKEIRDANKETDDKYLLVNQYKSSYHFDDEDFVGGSTRLINLRCSIVQALMQSPPNGALAREYLGGALHTLQDYYAHTTWVENNGSAIDTRLGTQVLPPADPNFGPCATHQGEPVSGFTSGYFPLPGKLVGGFGSPCSTTTIPKYKCLHGWWQWIGNPFFNPYFQAGGPEILVTLCDGISKDYNVNPYHDTAKTAAISATIDYVNQILNDDRIKGNEPAIAALMDAPPGLAVTYNDADKYDNPDFPPPFGGDEADAMVRILNSIAPSAYNNRFGVQPPSRYAYVYYDDRMNLFGPVINRDASTFVGTLQATPIVENEADDAEDLPEAGYPVMGAILTAMNQVPASSRIYVVAPPATPDNGGAEDSDLDNPYLTEYRDYDLNASLVKNVVAQARKRNIKIYFVVSVTQESITIRSDIGINGSYLYSSENIDDVCRSIAKATGGDVLDTTLAAALSVFDSDATDPWGDDPSSGGAVAFRPPFTPGPDPLQTTNTGIMPSLVPGVPVTIAGGPLVPTTNSIAVPVDSPASNAVFTLQLLNSADTDVFGFGAHAGDNITAILDNVAGIWSGQLKLLAPDGTTVLASSALSVNPECTLGFQIPAPGVYYLQITKDDPASQAVYDLSLTAITNNIGNEIEPNDDGSTATPIEYGDLIHGSVGSGPPADVDYYTFHGHAGDQVTITVSQPDGAWDGQVEILGNWILGWSTNDGATTYTRTEPLFNDYGGVEYLAVTKSDPSSAGDYTLSISTNTIVDGGPEVEPNDAPASATPIKYWTKIHGSLGLPILQNFSLQVPSGQTVNVGDPGVIFCTNGPTITMMFHLPEPGVWTMNVGGFAGSYQATATVQSPIELMDFYFATLTGRLGHEGLFAIPGQPLATTNQGFVAEMSDPRGSNVGLSLVDETGAAITPVMVTNVTPFTSTNDFVGECAPPAQPFRVAVTGVDQNGAPYQRIFPTLFTASTVAVDVDTNLVPDLVAGTTVPNFIFSITNFGAPDVFNVTIAGGQAVVAPTSATTLALGTGESAEFSAAIYLPLSSAPLSDVLLSVTATSTNDPAIGNTGVFDVPVDSYANVVADSVGISGESFLPTNGVVDPGEVVLVNLSLRNVGNDLVSNVVVMLQTNENVMPLAGTQTYGDLPSFGPDVARQFSFRAAGACSDSISLIFQIVGSPGYAGTITNAFPMTPTVPIQQTFRNPGAMVIPDGGPANVYPSTLGVSGVLTVSNITVTISNLSSARPSDLAILLVPSGATNDNDGIVLFYGYSGTDTLNNVTLTFDSSAASFVPYSGPIVSGTYLPTVNAPTPSFSPPAPPGPIYIDSLELASYGEYPANGIWNLYVLDVGPSDAGNPGSIAGGWSLNVSSVECQTGPEDSVGDGVPDWWRARFFGGTGISTNNLSCATCDADGTGQNNFFKYISGLDPTDPTSVFRLTILPEESGSFVPHLMFRPAVSGRTYTPLYSTDLTSDLWWPVTNSVQQVTNGGQGTITDTDTNELQRFYRLRISLP